MLLLKGCWVKEQVPAYDKHSDLKAALEADFSKFVSV